MALPALLSRGLDPILGVFTGFFAYYLHETHPRSALAPDERLSALLQWKWTKYQQNRRQQLLALDNAA